MRKDIFDYLEALRKDGLKPNYSFIARKYNCDARTVKRYFMEGEKALIWKQREPLPTLLDSYKDIIIEKYQNGACTVKSIYEYIKTQGYQGSYTTVKKLLQKTKNDK